MGVLESISVLVKSRSAIACLAVLCSSLPLFRGLHTDHHLLQHNSKYGRLRLIPLVPTFHRRRNARRHYTRANGQGRSAEKEEEEEECQYPDLLQTSLALAASKEAPSVAAARVRPGGQSSHCCMSRTRQSRRVASRRGCAMTASHRRHSTWANICAIVHCNVPVTIQRSLSPRRPSRWASGCRAGRR